MRQKLPILFRYILLVALLVAVHLGLIDTILYLLLAAPEILQSFSALLVYLTQIVLTIFLLDLFLVLVLLPILWKTRINREAGVIAIGTVIVFLVILHDLLMVGKRGVFQDLPVAITVTLGLSVSVGALGYFAAQSRMVSSPPRGRLTTLFILLPMCLTAVLLGLWFFLYRPKLSGWQWATGAAIMLLPPGVSACRPAWRRHQFWPSMLWGFALVFPGLILLVASLEVFPGTISSNKEPPSVRQVILLSVDTLRADALSCYGNTAFETPSIDSLARDGVVFQNALAPSPWTLPSLCSVLTGLYPNVHLANERDSRLSDLFPTLQETLQGMGYRTAAIGSNIYLNESFNLRQGFDYYQVYPRTSSPPLLASLKKAPAKLFPGAFPEEISSRALTEKASRWVRRHRATPFFLWFHYYDPHLPYSPPRRFLPPGKTESIGDYFNQLREMRAGTFSPTLRERQWIRALYDGEVRYVDEQIGVFLATLKQLGLYDDSLIVFVSDHGEEFWEHDGFEHGHSFHNELLHVPLVIKPPGGAFGGKRIRERVSIASLAPTIRELVQGPSPDAPCSVGSLSRLWKDPSEQATSEPLLAAASLYYEDRLCLVFDSYKYIVSQVSGREQLFHLETDPEELHDIAATHGAQLVKARGLLQEMQAKAQASRESYGIVESEHWQFDPQTRDRLQSLGYID